jgi:hypothetical protein
VAKCVAWLKTSNSLETDVIGIRRQPSENKSIKAKPTYFHQLNYLDKALKYVDRGKTFSIKGQRDDKISSKQILKERRGRITSNKIIRNEPTKTKFLGK